MTSSRIPILLALVTQSAAPTSLSGTVQDESGRPVAGAHVFISTAAPRKGTGVLCPSCYPDCRKSAVSDQQGSFAFRDLDPQLKFRLLVVARGFAPRYTPTHLVPGTDAAVVSLKAHDLDQRRPERVLRGRVVDGNGNSVAQAIVEADGVSHGLESQFGGLGELGIDELAVTDDDGWFRLGVGNDRDALYLRVKASFLAWVRTEPLAAGRTAHTIRLGPGVTITGRVIKQGKPQPDVSMGMVQTSRNSVGYLGHFEFATDHAGRFAFVNMPPSQDWFLYGLMDSLNPFGAIPVRPVRTQEHGSTFDLGDIEVQDAYRLTGRLILADHNSVPPGTRVLASRDGAWDSQTTIVGPDGRFSFHGLPAERMSLSTNVRGYHTSSKNASFDLLNKSSLLGTIHQDVDDLQFLLDPGSRPDFSPVDQTELQEYLRLRDRPLRGAPANE